MRLLDCTEEGIGSGRTARKASADAGAGMAGKHKQV